MTGPGIATPSAYASANVPLAGRTSYLYTVWYRVADGDTAVNHEFLRAQAVGDTLLRDDGFVEIGRVRPKLTLTKSVSPTGTIPVGTDLTCTMNFANVGEYAARAVMVADDVPPQVVLKVRSVTQTLPPRVSATMSYLDASGVPLVPGAAGCGAPADYDRYVRKIMWTLAGDLPAGATASKGHFGFIARIR